MTALSDQVNVPAAPAIDLVDETFLAVPPSTVAAAFADPGSWSRYWPDLVLKVYRDRGEEGMRWTVRGALIGTMEVWCEAMLDGTLLHYFLRATPADAAGEPLDLPPRQLAREYDARARAAKAIALGLKDTLEDGRQPGMPPRS
ncbi:polyketide cyclase / dehydrase and lipid transport [Haloechinothrix halophila]|uniref:polyketide cyclase / dehydrase and lipid transport n=1 Tax=Haloechinothrix halophila TaxID=1069073 RepID=UPI0038B39CB8